MASVFCIGSDAWSMPAMVTGAPPSAAARDRARAAHGSLADARSRGEAVQASAVGGRDLAPGFGSERAEDLLDRLPRVRERAVGVGIVRCPHARVGADGGNDLRCQLVLFECRHHLTAEQLAG